MRTARTLPVVLIALLAVSTLLAAYQVSNVNAAKKAVILSPLSWLYPIAYLGRLVSSLNYAGFTVELVLNQSVTVDFFRRHLTDYSLIIWRTEPYEWNHQIYWYLGEFAAPNSIDTYSQDIAAGRMDFHGFAAGIKWDFITYYYRNSSLAGRLIYILATRSLDIGLGFIQAGARTLIGFYGAMSLQWGFGDFVSRFIFNYLAQGMTVDETIKKTQEFFMKMQLESSIDTVVIPPLFYTGDGTLTLAALA